MPALWIVLAAAAVLAGAVRRSVRGLGLTGKDRVPVLAEVAWSFLVLAAATAVVGILIFGLGGVLR